MKPLPLVFAVSVAANLALAALLWRRPAPATRATSPAGPATTARNAKASGSAKDAAALQAALASGDATTLAAAGVSPDVIRTLAVGRAFDAFHQNMRAQHPTTKDDRYWRRDTSDEALTRAQRLQNNKIQSDFREAINQAYGYDLEAFFGEGRVGARMLSPEKHERLRRIERDYADMEQQIYADQNAGIQLPSDRDKLKLLRAEKERDIAAMLTAEERDQLALRDSSTARNVRDRLGDVLRTEEEFKKVYALQKAFDDRFGNQEKQSNLTVQQQQRVRRDAEKKLLDDMRDALTPEQWAAAQRANDPDARVIGGVVRRLELPAATTDAVLALRETYAAQSLQINRNFNLSASDRQTQMLALAMRAQAEINAKLGPEGGPAYLQYANWVTLLKNGLAFSLDPADAPDSRIQIGTAANSVAAPKVETPPRK